MNNKSKLTQIFCRYARVLLHAIYLDQVDLSLISRGGCGGGLGEAQALAHTGRARPSPLEEAMELYQIGRFLELDILSQGCEDLILEWLSLETLSVVLQWSHQAHGSAWVHRQVCFTFLNKFFLSHVTFRHYIFYEKNFKLLHNHLCCTS